MPGSAAKTPVRCGNLNRWNNPIDQCVEVKCLRYRTVCIRALRGGLGWSAGARRTTVLPGAPCMGSIRAHGL